MAQIDFSTSARRDLAASYRYLEEQAGRPVAERFLAGVQASCEQLMTMPYMAPQMAFEPPFDQMRRWPVKGFDRWSVVYRIEAAGLFVIRVLHGARDLPRTLVC